MTTTERHTERSVLGALARRYSMRYGNGQRYVCASHVRCDAGFDATNTADFVAVDTWPSSGCAIHGHEVKCSRSDWLRELAKPWKAEPFLAVVDYWWIVVPDKSIVKPDELPERFGLLVLGGAGLRVKVAAERLHPCGDGYYKHRDAPPIPRGFVAALLRAMARPTNVISSAESEGSKDD